MGNTATPYADVALKMPARRWFTYRVPDALVPYARPGVRVLVPLRNESAVGVLGRMHHEPPDMATRDLTDVIDDVPWFDTGMLKLGQWLSDYYFCSPGEALFAMLPGGLKATVDTVYHHAPERVPTAKLSLADRKLCLYLSEQPGATRRELLGVFPQSGTARRLDRLVAEGTVSAQRRVRPHRVSAGTRRAVEWIGNGDRQQGSDAPLARRLREAGCPVPAETIQQDFPGAARELARLSRRRLIRSVAIPAAYEPRLPPLEVTGDIALTAAQQHATDEIVAALGEHATFLLYGVTGSGKTEVYIRAIRAALQHGGQALYLVPEIGLANHLLARLAPHFRSRVVLLHSGLTEKERALAWRAVHAGERTLVVGTRSAALAPLDHLRIVVVDEEQDPSFKQDHPSPRYHGRDVAIWRARASDAVCVLGTATPSLETWHHAQTGKYRLLELPQRVSARSLPKIHLVDRRRERPPAAGGLITPTLRARLAHVLEDGGQAILFLNRRGYSGALRCSDCGRVVQCPDCSVAYSYHRDRTQLRCHFCGRSEAAPEMCASCRSTDYLYPRAGTQKLEDELDLLFPRARTARLDLDVASRRGRAADLLARFGRRELDILMGTQMITKGLHFPHVALVGILNTDMSLDLPDFRSAERTVQLILQVAGRAGRGDRPGEVYVQTWQPDLEVYRHLENGDYRPFANAELLTREALDYPPFRRLILIVAQATEDEAAERGIRKVAAALHTSSPASYRLMGPAPAPLRRLRKYYRWQLILKTARVKGALNAVESAIAKVSQGSVRFNVDVDPTHLL